ncbi:MAG: glycogen/starch/alpha-glucan phosphorylase [Bacillota bacterium]
MEITKELLEERLKQNIARQFGVSIESADKDMLYRTVSLVVKNILLEKRKEFNQKVVEGKKRKVYYMCMEFLLGRSLKTSINNLKIEGIISDLLAGSEFSLEDLYECEPDAGLGNGGLGRLAACYMDSLASLDYPAMGFSLRYEYGLFKQKIVDGWQTEMPDVWLPGGEVWLTPRPDKNTVVKFGGRVELADDGNGNLDFTLVDYNAIEAVAYDMAISGVSEGVSTLRLWRARNVSTFNMNSFSQGDYMAAMQKDSEAEMITKVLYPSDNHDEGKILRLQQQYFLVSASLNNIIRDVIRNTGDVRKMPEVAMIHINDTHPALCIPELMRILLDDFKLSWDEAWDIVVKTTNYTNHTVLAEALECWSVDLVAGLVPRVWQIICEIDRRFKQEVQNRGLESKLSKMGIIDYGTVRMANLSVVGSSKVNGVSALHSEILKDDVFSDFHKFYPGKFTNVTNGIAHRRWLSYSNRGLAALIAETIGDDYMTKPYELEKLLKYKSNKTFLNKLDKIKRANKVDFSNFVKKTQGFDMDPDSIFDVQSKRLHEYKRQLMNALKIIKYIKDIRENPNMDFVPQTFIFGAKAAPSYFLAKEIIKLICCLAKEIENDPVLKGKINVVFLENYCVSMAEKMMPASEVSEQISTAGKEASGTGNMKFMINGALTLGTLDGANVEIAELVGNENCYIFGNTADEVEKIWNNGYNSIDYYMSSPMVHGIVNELRHGFAGQDFSNLANYLVNNHGISDPFMCLCDLESYINTAETVAKDYLDRQNWLKKSLVNIAKAGHFAADRSIEEYAKDIWHLERP